jgi:hypothetical protein
MDAQKSLSFPSSDGRELTLTVNVDEGIAVFKEVLDGEEMIVSTNTSELSVIARFIEGLIEERDYKRKRSSRIQQLKPVM